MKTSLPPAVAIAAAVVCVYFIGEGRASAPPGRYTFPVVGVVYDTRTHLTWQQAADPNPETGTLAAVYCSTLPLAGGGWRLPSMKELQTIVDESVTVNLTTPTIDPNAFPNTPASWFWTSSLLAGYPAMAWGVYFDNGTADYAGLVNPGQVRCVR